MPRPGKRSDEIECRADYSETCSKKGRGMARRSLDLIEAMRAIAEAAQPCASAGDDEGPRMTAIGTLSRLQIGAMTDEPSVIAELTQAERDTLRADVARWKCMGSGGHLQDWLDYYPGLSIRRRLAMKLSFTNRPEGKGYALGYSQLMRDDRFDTDDKTMMSQTSAVL